MQVGDEVVSIGKIAGPIMILSLLIQSRSIISMFFLSHLGREELAGGSLAMGFGNITGISVIKGLSFGMDPICGQAYGARRYSVLSQTFHRTLYMLLLTCVPVCILWLNVEPIFLRLGQDPDATKIAKVFLVAFIPELIAQSLLHPIRTFLKSQGITTPLTVSAICAVLLHPLINYLFTMYFRLGVRGIALALGFTTFNLNLGLVIYMVVSETPLKPWHGVTMVSVFQGWKPLLTLALPSLISVCLEFWWYEIMLFLCGLLDNPKASVAAMGILIQTTGVLYNFPYSLSSCISTRVSQALGAGRPSRAHLAANIGLFMAFAFGLLAFVTMIVMRSWWGTLFTDEPQIINLISTVLPILGLCEVGNSPQTVACGVLTGTARPKDGVRINLCSFYIVGLPVAILTTFTFKFGFKGLWFGLLAAQFSCVCMMMYTFVRTDWKHQAKRADELTTASAGTDDLETSLLTTDH
ncbi:Detected protein of confused Function [Hibiscus syriacus]|uniref:Protein DETOXIFICATION n=1 Tax=Hibiscus syriacus TaxID=106335 RepID=A0A6A2YFT4_HIBSY|nr:protein DETOXIFICATION 53-like [Hibiscus syriacus]KAE8673907.1 Detected protein of confused Function [Hibiscus syriacus]